jgi:hypothetical protein
MAMACREYTTLTTLLIAPAPMPPSSIANCAISLQTAVNRSICFCALWFNGDSIEINASPDGSPP